MFSYKICFFEDFCSGASLLESGINAVVFPLSSGIAVGHVYFFLEDVFPNQPGGGRWLKTPSIM